MRFYTTACRLGRLAGLVLAGLMSAAMPSAAAAERVLAENGRTGYVIVEPESPTPVELTTVRDLASLLRQITGAEFPVVGPAAAGGHGKRVFVGYSAPMRAVAGEEAPAGYEERVYRTVGDDLLLYGDGVCGTVFAVYQFLQEQLDCRWFHPWGDSRIPRQERLVLPDCQRRMTPSYLVRDMLQGAWNTAGCPTSQDFFRRQRIHNSSSLSAIRQIGLNVHTLPTLVPSGIPNLRGRNRPHALFKDKEYFKTNPEYFSLDRQGRRTYQQHYCFANPGLRRTLTENVETLVRAAGAADAFAVINIDQADVGDHFCYCESCQALERKYQSPCGPLLDYLLEASAHFQGKHPRLLLRFLAYNREQTEFPPAAEALPGGVLPDNLVPYFAPITGDFSKAWDSPSNQVVYDSLVGWGRVSSRMWLYYYPSTYPRPLVHYPLFGNVRRCARDYQLGYASKIRYVFNDEGFPLENMGFASLQLYLRTMLSNDITQDVETMIREYMSGVYGPAAAAMYAYFDELERLMAADDGYLRWNPDPRFVSYLTPDNLVRWQGDFDAMEALAAGDARALLQVRTARMNLDLNTMHLWQEIRLVRPDAAGSPALAPDRLYQRYLAGVEAVLRHSFDVTLDNGVPAASKLRLYEAKRGWMLAAGEHFHAIARGPKPLPAAFAGVPAECLRQVTPASNKTRVPPDESAAFGIALAADAPRVGAVQYRFHDSLRQRAPISLAVPVQSGGSYRLYYLGRTALSRECAVTVPSAGSGGTYGTAFLGHCWDREKPDQPWDIYVSCRFADGKVFTDRLVLVLSDGQSAAIPVEPVATAPERPSVMMIAKEVAPAQGEPAAVDWASATPTSPWGDAFNGEPAPAPSPELQVAFDDDWLYLAYAEHRDSGQATGQFWNNVVDMFFAGDSAGSVLQVGVAPSGEVRCNLYSLIKTSDPDRNEDQLVSKAVPFAGQMVNRQEDGRWSWQMALPRRVLPTLSGGVLRANFFRNHGSAGVSWSWNPIYVQGYLNGFHRLGAIGLGRLELSGAAVTASRRQDGVAVMDGNDGWDIKAPVPAGLDLRRPYRVSARVRTNARPAAGGDKDGGAGTSRIGVYDPAARKITGNAAFAITSIAGEEFKAVSISRPVALTEASFLYVGGFLPARRFEGEVFLQAFVLEPAAP